MKKILFKSIYCQGHESVPRMAVSKMLLPTFDSLKLGSGTTKFCHSWSKVSVAVLADARLGWKERWTLIFGRRHTPLLSTIDQARGAHSCMPSCAYSEVRCLLYTISTTMLPLRDRRLTPNSSASVY